MSASANRRQVTDDAVEHVAGQPPPRLAGNLSHRCDQRRSPFDSIGIAACRRSGAPTMSCQPGAHGHRHVNVRGCAAAGAIPSPPHRLAAALTLTGEEREQLLAAAQPAPRHRTAAAEQPPLRSLPLPATYLVGRVAELATMCSLLRRADLRLLTLTGPIGGGGPGVTKVLVTDDHTLVGPAEGNGALA